MSTKNEDAVDGWRPLDPYVAGVKLGTTLGYIGGFAMGLFVMWLVYL